MSREVWVVRSLIADATEARQRAGVLAGQVKGVRGVMNNVQVSLTGRSLRLVSRTAHEWQRPLSRQVTERERTV